VLAILDLSMQGLNFSLEQSRDEYRGLSHWEWGNNTRALPFLIETPNPGQTTHLSNRDPVNDPVNPLHHRVGKQLTGSLTGSRLTTPSTPCTTASANSWP